MNRLLVLACTISIVFMCWASGCTRGIKEGIAVVQGAKGKFHAFSDPSIDLAAFDSIEVEEFSTEYPLIPSTFSAMLRSRLIEDLRKKNQPVDQAGQKTLLVRGRIIYYESSDELEHVWGPLEEVIAIVTLVDKSAGSVVASAGCVGRSTASAGTGVQTKVEGLAKAVANWIEKYRPSPG